MSDAEMINRYSVDAIRSLQLARWCSDHNDLMFFCEHKHETFGQKVYTINTVDTDQVLAAMRWRDGSAAAR